MSSSPHIPENVKEYMRKFSLQKLINQSVNGLLKTCPDDPYSYLIGQFQKLASQDIELKKIIGKQIMSGDGFPVIKIFVQCVFMNKQILVNIGEPLGILSQEGMLYDEDRHNGKGMKKGIKFLEKLSQKIAGYKCSQQNEIDNLLVQQFTNNGNMGMYQLYISSYIPSLLQSKLLHKPLYEIFNEASKEPLQKQMKVMLNCLHGGKAIGSKCKVFKYYLMGTKVQDPWLVQNIMLSIRKTIASGKGGEAALKFSPDGTFICPVDTIMDNLKIVQDAINANNAKDSFSIGLSWAADTLYAADTKKYESENPKTPFDNDQMIDYLVKLLIDKPIVKYLEDPLASSQKASWKKLINKIRENEATKNVKIGVRNGKIINLFQDVKTQISELSINQTSQTHPDLSQQALNQANSLKFTLDLVQCRAFQLKTFSKLLEVKRALSKTKTQLILQDNNLETFDTTIVDLCYGTNSYLNLGSISKFDRISKINRMAQIILE